MAWHDGIDADSLTAIQSKGWHQLDDAGAAKAIFNSYRGLEKVAGQASSSDYVKAADAGATDPTVAAAFWSRLGRPADANGYTLDGITLKDGSTFDEGFAGAMKKAALAANLTPVQLKALMTDLVPFMDQEEQSETNARQARRQADEAALATEWGANLMANKYIANKAIDALKQTTGHDFSPALAALEGVEGGGYAAVQKMFLALGNMMGEGRFIPAGGAGGGPAAVDATSARAQLDALMNDQGWRERALRGDVQALKQRADLNAIIARDLVGQR